MFMPEGNYNFKYARKLMLMVGNIGAGKTTYIKSLNQEYITLSRDKMRFMIGNGEYIFSFRLENAIWHGELELFKGMINEGVNIAIDEINTNKNMRGRYIHQMLVNTWDSNKYEVIAVVFPRLSKKESVDRRMKDNHDKSIERITWEEVWDHFDKNYTPPTIEEGFDKIIYLDKNNKSISKDKWMTIT
jgi:predicted kinase